MNRVFSLCVFPQIILTRRVTVRGTPGIAFDDAFFGFYFLTHKHNKLLFRRNINKCEKNMKRVKYKRTVRAVSTNNLRGEKNDFNFISVFRK